MNFQAWSLAEPSSRANYWILKASSVILSEAKNPGTFPFTAPLALGENRRVATSPRGISGAAYDTVWYKGGSCAISSKARAQRASASGPTARNIR